jgi:hypothetical protein
MNEERVNERGSCFGGFSLPRSKREMARQTDKSEKIIPPKYLSFNNTLFVSLQLQYYSLGT